MSERRVLGKYKRAEPWPLRGVSHPNVLLVFLFYGEPGANYFGCLVSFQILLHQKRFHWLHIKQENEQCAGETRALFACVKECSWMPGSHKILSCSEIYTCFFVGKLGK